MKPALYVLSEGERDELFYERLCERLTGLSFQKQEEFRYSPGANWKTVFRLSRLLLSRFAHFETPQEMVVLLAVDNDRAPGHPGHRTYPRPLPAQDQKKEARFPRMREMVNEKLGTDPLKRNVHAVIAMPVEMIESWLLPLLEATHSDANLPPFAEADSAIAREYYGNKQPPPQLKDLREEIRKMRKLDPDTLFWEAADSGELARLAGAGSFALFRGDAEILKTVWKV